MKRHLHFILLTLTLGTALAHGQGTFVYDQQSSTDETPLPYGAGPVIQQLMPAYGQSFTPSLSSVDFIRLNLNDNNATNGLGATLYVNLRANSINGSILDSTAPVALTDGFTGVVNFLFATPVPLTPGVTYFFQPVVQSGDLWNVDVSEYRYPGGTSFYGGSPLTGGDYWFREGIVVPEPSSAWLVLLGAGMFIWCRRKNCRSR